MIAILVMFLWQLLKVTGDIFLKNWGESDEPALYIKLYLAFSLVSVVFIFVRAIIVMIFGIRGARILHDKMVNTLTNAPVNLFFDVTPTGRVLNRLSKD